VYVELELTVVGVAEQIGPIGVGLGVGVCAKIYQ
jgi:hypothetical protein